MRSVLVQAITTQKSKRTVLWNWRIEILSEPWDNVFPCERLTTAILFVKIKRGQFTKDLILVNPSSALRISKETEDFQLLVSNTTTVDHPFAVWCSSNGVTLHGQDPTNSSSAIVTSNHGKPRTLTSYEDQYLCAHPWANASPFQVCVCSSAFPP